jgi:hypothetical protein
VTAAGARATWQNAARIAEPGIHTLCTVYVWHRRHGLSVGAAVLWCSTLGTALRADRLTDGDRLGHCCRLLMAPVGPDTGDALFCRASGPGGGGHQPQASYACQAARLRGALLETLIALLQAPSACWRTNFAVCCGGADRLKSNAPRREAAVVLCRLPCARVSDGAPSSWRWPLASSPDRRVSALVWLSCWCRLAAAAVHPHTW